MQLQILIEINQKFDIPTQHLYTVDFTINIITFQ